MGLEGGNFEEGRLEGGNLEEGGLERGSLEECSREGKVHDCKPGSGGQLTTPLAKHASKEATSKKEDMREATSKKEDAKKFEDAREKKLLDSCTWRPSF